MKKRTAFAFLALVFIIVMAAAGCSERQTDPIITFESDGGSAVAEREKTASVFPVATKEGFRIEGWYEDKYYKKRATFPYTATKDTTLYAKWTDVEKGSDGIEYERTEDGKAFVAVSYRDPSYSVCVPDEHLGLPVVKIASGFMKNRSYVGLFLIGKNVAQIDEEFYRCVSLTRFEVRGVNENYAVENDALVDVSDKEERIICAYPRGLRTEEYTVNIKVGKDAFLYNSSIKNLTLGENASAEEGAFKEMTVLESFTVNESNGYFSAKDGILYSKDFTVLYNYPANKKGTEAVIPDSVITVEDGAFENSKVSVITLGKGVENYEDYSSVPYLTEFKVKSGNPFYKAEEGLIYGADGKTLYRVPQALEGEARVKEGAETISNFAFYETGKITSVFLPKSVKTVCDFAFYYCTEMTNLRFEEESEVEEIRGGAFVKCDKLKEMTVTSRVPPKTGDEGIDCGEFASGFKIIIPDNAKEAYEYFWDFGVKYFDATGRGVTTYTVTFDSNGGSDAGSFHGLLVREPEEPTKEGMIFTGWYDNKDCFGEKIEFPFVTQGHATLYACWELLIE